MKEKIKSNPWIFKTLIVLALAVSVFNLFYTATTVFGAGLLSNTGPTGNFGGAQQSSTSQGAAASQGTMLPYGVTFDQAGYDKLLGFDKSIGQSTMTTEQWQRYIKIGTGERTGCGPCCGIGNGPAIDANGNSRCGCGHIYALEGLMKHLVQNYGDKYTDAQIFEEVVKWKKLFFPGQVADDGSVIG